MTADIQLRNLAECERVIERGMKTFIEVGRALMAIRDERLYKSEYKTFEEYCRERWGWTSRRVNQLVSAAEVGTIVPGMKNEAQARELGPIADDPDVLEEVIEEIEEEGGFEEVPARAIREKVQQRKPTRTRTYEPEEIERIVEESKDYEVVHDAVQATADITAAAERLRHAARVLSETEWERDPRMKGGKLAKAMDALRRATIQVEEQIK